MLKVGDRVQTMAGPYNAAGEYDPENGMVYKPLPNFGEIVGIDGDYADVLMDGFYPKSRYDENMGYRVSFEENVTAHIGITHLMRIASPFDGYIIERD